LRSSEALGFWSSWTQRLWRKAEAAWLERDGQDHFYRRTVVVPALRARLERWAKSPEMRLVDVGCGDAFTTHLLLRESHAVRSRTREIVLIDRSAAELRAARRSFSAAEVNAVRADVLSPDWQRHMPKSTRATAFCAVFVLQELPMLGPILRGLRGAMRRGDIFLAIIVAPQYADSLRASGKIMMAAAKPTPRRDWSWAAGYPITTPTGTIYLPHFQRPLSSYRRLFRAAGLVVESWEGLGIGTSRRANGVFDKTIYGRRIVGRVSSRLLVARRG